MRNDRDHITALTWLVLVAAGVAWAAWYMVRRFDLLHPKLLGLLALPLLLGLLHLWRLRRGQALVPLPTLQVLANGPADAMALAPAAAPCCWVERPCCCWPCAPAEPR